MSLACAFASDCDQTGARAITRTNEQARENKAESERERAGKSDGERRSERWSVREGE